MRQRQQAGKILLPMGHVCHMHVMFASQLGHSSDCPDHTGCWAADTVQLGYLSCGQTVMQQNMHATHMTHRQRTDPTMCICATSLAWQAVYVRAIVTPADMFVQDTCYASQC